MPMHKEPLRILHVLDHSLPLHSGYAFRTAAILREQRRLGWVTAQLTGPKHHCALPEERIGDVGYARVGHTMAWLGRVAIINQIDVVMALRRRLRRIVAEFRPHIIHAHSPCLNGLAAAAVARQRGLPFVYEMRASWEDAAVSHGTTVEGSLRYRVSHALESRVLRAADVVTTICAGLQRDITSRGVPPRRVFVIPNAVDLEHFTPVGNPDSELRDRYCPPGSRVVGFIGSFYAYEGLDLLLQAMPELLVRHPPLHLVLVGGGPEEARLRSLTADLGITRSVSFAGQVPQAEIPRYYSIMDVMVYARRRNRLTDLVTPLKPLEAMALGRLVVASDVGGHRELISHRDTGLLFPAGEPGAIAAAIATALDKDIQADICKRARRYVEEHRSWRAVVAGYRRAYGSVLAVEGRTLPAESQA
jgi:PEP-CTERM/exosortase A-associated glycosyltransferase